MNQVSPTFAQTETVKCSLDGRIRQFSLLSYFCVGLWANVGVGENNVLSVSHCGSPRMMFVLFFVSTLGKYKTEFIHKSIRIWNNHSYNKYYIHTLYNIVVSCRYSSSNICVAVNAKKKKEILRIWQKLKFPVSFLFSILTVLFFIISCLINLL